MFQDDLTQQSVIKQCVKSPLIANCKSQVPALFLCNFATMMMRYRKLIYKTRRNIPEFSSLQILHKMFKYFTYSKNNMNKFLALKLLQWTKVCQSSLPQKKWTFYLNLYLMFSGRSQYIQNKMMNYVVENIYSLFV